MYDSDSGGAGWAEVLGHLPPEEAAAVADWLLEGAGVPDDDPAAWAGVLAAPMAGGPARDVVGPEDGENHRGWRCCAGRRGRGRRRRLRGCWPAVGLLTWG